MHSPKWIKEQSEKATCFMIPTIWHSERQNNGDSSKTSGCHELEKVEEWMNRCSTSSETNTAWHYNGEYMSLRLCQNQQQCTTQRVNPMSTMDFS